MKKFKFAQNQVVQFFLTQEIRGKGQIVGCATTELPVMGRNYIVKVLDGDFPSKDYPFDTIIVPEINLSKLICPI